MSGPLRLAGRVNRASRTVAALRHNRPSAKTPDASPFEINDDFERFSQVNDVFARSRWDEKIRDDRTDTFFATYRRPLTKWRKANGFTQKDYAIRNAAWHVADVFAEMYEDDDRRDGFLDDLSMLREGASERVDVGTPAVATRELKQVAKTFGADLVGVAAHDERWIYTERFSAGTGEAKPNQLPDGLTHVVVIGQEMDDGLIKTAPSALSGAATGLGYSRDAVVLLATAQYIRNLGYQAIASMNDTALAIPLAIAAGLGEYGRHGLVITPELGPRLRIGKIFTDMPLGVDEPKAFGVKEFCAQCDRCADKCPASAIPHGDPDWVPINISSIRGVKKWSVDGEKCFGYWSKINSDCAVCVRVCPYTRDYSKRRNRAWLRLAGTPLRGLAMRLHDTFGGSNRVRSKDWWSG
jgi:epoxyqueuosine reductase